MPVLNDENIQSARTILIENLPYSPFDFIREISTIGDKETFVDSLLKNISAKNDLRFVYRVTGGQKIAVVAEKLLWDSDFFGYGIAKLSGMFLLKPPYFEPMIDYTEPLQHLLKLAQQSEIRYLFAYVDPRDLASVRALNRAGFQLIETRVYYHMDLRGYEYKERYDVRAATADDVPQLGQTAANMVNLYDRFHSDPFICHEDANRLMYRWVEASILDSFADITIVPNTSKPTAFCTVKYHKDKWAQWNLKLAQPVFSAVSNEYRGWYRKLISEINYYLRDMGAEHAYLATQITNKAVVWVWESLGYRFGKGEYVYSIVL